MDHYFWVAVKCILQDPEGKILIIFKSDREDVNPNDFDLPGGRVQWGEKLEDALKREVKEEVHLDIEIVRISKTRWFTQGELHLVWITYIVTCADISPIRLSEEHTGYFWKTKEEILSGNYPQWLKEEVVWSVKC